MATATFSLPSEITPNATKSALTGNYLDIQNNGWAQQYLPELYEQEVERYGDRTIGGFLRMVGAEMPMASDQVIWSEQARLHLSYTATLVADSSNTNVINTFVTTGAKHAIRKGQTIVISDGTTTSKAYVTEGIETSETAIKVKSFKGTTGLVGDDSLVAGSVTLFVYGSVFAKGVSGMTGSIEPKFQTFTNKPMILKDRFEVSGSDAAQIGWVEVTGEGGQTGYLWYLKAEGDTRTRFEDYCEMSMIEAETIANTSLTGAGVEGSEGMFAAITSRGNVATNVFDTPSDTISDFDLILKELDKQGAIEENMNFLDRSSNLNLDDALGAVNANYSGGTSFGVFQNSQEMALNLGFTGFRRGSYDFYKTDWKYLNDQSTRGLISDIKGVLVPAGTSSVYDQSLGKNIRRPFLHTRYRSSQSGDRNMKSWTTGSVGGATTSDLDAMEVHYLSEKCLVTQAANNFVLFK